ncbi:hypothetical protein [Nocardioides pyridinolyticus]
MNATHVATIPPDLSLKLLDAVLGALEAALLQVGAERVWVADGPALEVMVDFPNEPTSELATNPRSEAQEHVPC